MLYNNDKKRMPPYLAEIPYGFKNLWKIEASVIDELNNAIAEENITFVSLNGSSVTVAQLKALYDWNRDAASLEVSNGNGLFITLTGYDKETALFTYDQLISQNVEVNGVVSITGDMVDNTNPSAPVVNHDTTKLDASVYNGVVPGLVNSVDTLNNTVDTLKNTVNTLNTSAVTSVTLNNGTPVYPVNGNIDLEIEGMTPEQIQTALDAKIDKSIASNLDSNVSVSVSNAGVLNHSQTKVNTDTGASETTNNTYDLKSILGINTLNDLDYQYAYLVNDSLVSGYDSPVTIQRTNLYRYNADGSTYTPTETTGVRTVIAVTPDYSAINTVRKQMIAAIGVVTASTSTAVTVAFTAYNRFTVYNRFNGYRVGTLVYDPTTFGLYEVIQTISKPATELAIIPITNTSYYKPSIDRSVMSPMSFFANLDNTYNPGTFYTVDDARLAMMKGSSQTYAGYADYVEFSGNTIPANINTDGDWNANISVWVTDGIIFTSLSSLLTYLSGFSSPTRYKTSNLGIVYTQYHNGGISITPKFGISTISNGLSGVYIPVDSDAVTGNLAVFDNGGIVTDSGVAPSAFATAAQGAKADSAVQSVAIASGSANGKIKLTVNGNATEASVTGLGTAAYTASTEYATAAQGTKADNAVQTVSLASGTNSGTVKLTVNGVATDNIAVKGLGTAAFTSSSAYATSTQGAKADSALQSSDVVDSLSSTSTTTPLSANQGRILQQQIQSISASGKPIGGFATYADRYTNTSQFASDLLPINVGDYIYIAVDENHTDQPAQYAVASVTGGGDITYSFLKIVPDSARDFTLNPITSTELANNAVTNGSITDGAVTTGKIANGAVTTEKLSSALQTTLANMENSIISPIAENGTGNVVTGVTTDVNNVLQVTAGYAYDTLTTSGSGNAVASVSANNNTLTQIMTTLIQSVAKGGSGNALTGVSTDASGNVTLSSDTFLQQVTTSGTGNVVTGISASGGTVTATMGTMIASLPDASTNQKGIVQLNNTLTSTSTTQALTAAQGKALNDSITTKDALVVHLANTETITGTKTFAAHPVVPSKTTLPASPSATQYATEAQAATNYAKVAGAVTNNLVGFGADGTLIDTGIAYGSVNNITISGTTPTTINGMLIGNGSVVTAAVAGTDYQTPLVAGTDYATPSSIPSAYTSTPEMDGTGSAGTGTAYARGNHVHPTDTSRQAAITVSGLLKGTGSAVVAAVAGTDYAPAYSPFVTLSANTTLNSNHFGTYCMVTGTSTITLPTASSSTLGVEIEIHNVGTGVVTVTGALLVGGSSYSSKSITLETDEAITVKCIASSGNGAWAVIGSFTEV